MITRPIRSLCAALLAAGLACAASAQPQGHREAQAPGQPHAREVPGRVHPPPSSAPSVPHTVQPRARDHVMPAQPRPAPGRGAPGPPPAPRAPHPVHPWARDLVRPAPPRPAPGRGAPVPRQVPGHVAPAPPIQPRAPQFAAPRPPVFNGPMRLDDRYRHDHYYPAPGFRSRTLPSGSFGVRHGGVNWFYHGGVWFRPDHGSYIVAMPPLGIVVPFLPPAYVTLWVGGAPYYYADGVYYSAAAGGYAVVAPPAEVATVQTEPQPPSYVIYPRMGQSPEQTDADRIACNQWAAMQPGGTTDPWLFQRAFEACMDGRGYTVR